MQGLLFTKPFDRVIWFIPSKNISKKANKKLRDLFSL